MAQKSRDVWKFNFATDRKLRERVEQTLIPTLKQRRENRQDLENDWEKFYNMWALQHDEHHTYMGRAKLYIPQVRKDVESQARQLSEAAMPNDDFFDCSPGLGGTRKGAVIRKSIARWQIEQCKLRTKLHVFNRQEVLLGTSPVYLPWREETNRVLRRARNPKTGKIELKREQVYQYRGPDFITRDLFRWYALNPTKASHKEDGCFEDFNQSYFDLLALKKKGMIADSVWEEILAAKTEAYDTDELRRYVERVEQMGLSLNNMSYQGEAEVNKDSGIEKENRNFLATLAFLPMVLPEACEEGEDSDMPIPVQVAIYNNQHVGMIMRNQFWHQSDPYLVGKYILPNADEFYGQGLPYSVQYLQHELNSTAEQTMDSKTLALNPLAAIDPALAAQLNDFEIAPGAKWFVRPDGIKLFSLPDLSGTGYAAMNQLRTSMSEYSDRAPALPPQISGKARSATQAEIVDRAYTVDLKAFQVNNEIEVLQPMLRIWESLTDQNIDDDQVVMILGRRATDWRRKLISKNSVLGSYEYFWKATTVFQQKPVKARQMLDMYKVILSMPPEQAAKLNFNHPEFIKIMWADMWELPDAEKLFGSGEMESTDPELEHKMLELGQEIEVLPGDDDQDHAAKHVARIEKLTEGSSERRQLEVHVLLHNRQAEMKQKIAQQRMMMQAMMMQQAQNAQGQGRESAMRGSGNRTQLSPNANAGDMASGMRP